MTQSGKLLKSMRLKAGLNIEEVAKGLGVGNSFISRMESGDKKIPAKQVSELARILSLTEHEMEALNEAMDLDALVWRMKKVKRTGRFVMIMDLIEKAIQLDKHDLELVIEFAVILRRHAE